MAERVAEVLRERIINGSLPPATRLSEDQISATLGVSRNTLREAFKLLAHERLLEHQLNRGVFVRRLDASDVVDIYRVRRLIEVAAVRTAEGADTSGVAESIRVATEAAQEQRWRDVGTADIRFHLALAALAGSPRVDEAMRQVFAELRLVFHAMPDPRTFHEPYLERNVAIAGLVEAGRLDEAGATLTDYLHDAESALLAVVG
jgi:DNA-binding GntR family transcriptional regulator